MKYYWGVLAIGFISVALAWPHNVVAESKETDKSFLLKTGGEVTALASSKDGAYLAVGIKKPISKRTGLVSAGGIAIDLGKAFRVTKTKSPGLALQVWKVDGRKKIVDETISLESDLSGRLKPNTRIVAVRFEDNGDVVAVTSYDRAFKWRAATKTVDWVTGQALKEVLAGDAPRSLSRCGRWDVSIDPDGKLRVRKVADDSLLWETSWPAACYTWYGNGEIAYTDGEAVFTWPPQ